MTNGVSRICLGLATAPGQPRELQPIDAVLNVPVRQVNLFALWVGDFLVEKKSTPFFALPFLHPDFLLAAPLIGPPTAREKEQSTRKWSRGNASFFLSTPRTPPKAILTCSDYRSVRRSLKTMVPSTVADTNKRRTLTMSCAAAGLASSVAACSICHVRHAWAENSSAHRPVEKMLAPRTSNNCAIQPLKHGLPTTDFNFKPDDD